MSNPNAMTLPVHVLESLAIRSHLSWQNTPPIKNNAVPKWNIRAQKDYFNLEEIDSGESIHSFNLGLALARS